MREPVKDKGKLEHMPEAIDLKSQRTSCMTLEDFDADKVV
jgi:hypothetical protein